MLSVPAPLSPEEMEEGPSGSSLARDPLEQIFGGDKDQILQEAMHDESLSPEQRILATELIIGLKNPKDIAEQELADLTEIANHVTSSVPRSPQPQPIRREEEELEEYSGYDPYSSVNG